MAADFRNPGGTPGGTRAFLLGLVMIVVGGYLLLNQVQVYGGYWYFGWAGSYGRSFGITLIPLLFGIGMLFYDGRSFAGRVLCAGGRRRRARGRGSRARAGTGGRARRRSACP